MNCSGHGACYNSSCWCHHGFSGAYCEMLGPGATPMPGMLGATPLPWLGSTPIYSAPCREGGCSSRGTCNTDTGLCLCDPGYTGSECETFLIAQCVNDCSQNGACLNGTCMCDLNWGGDDCSSPSTCGGHSTHLSVNCSGHGMCLNGTCACENGWGGADCSSVNCADDCSGRGVCANGTCACDFGWRGAECSTVSCPRDCSGHGTCSGHHAVPTCVCDGLWTGADCTMQLCPTTATMQQPYVACSGHGACTQNGTCICYKNFDGDDCNLLIDCSGRGVRKCGFCRCDGGFIGADCETDVCEDSRVYDPAAPTDYRLGSVCSGKGTCTTLKGCVCDEGAGRNCSLPGKCELNCNNHGKCVGQNGIQNDPGTCICDRYTIANSPFTTPMYDGVSCQNKLCPGVRNIGTIQVVCSGKGVCNNAGNTKTCDCFNVINEGLYSGIDCGVPPNHFVSDIEPKVGPLEGGTIITVSGPGLERLLSTKTKALDNMYCKFENDGRTKVEAGPVPDSVICISRPVATSKTVQLTFVDERGITIINPARMSAQFEYFVQTRIVRVLPSYAPLRPNGINGQFAPDLKRANMITVTGDYFPPNGKYVCRFGDCDALPGKTQRLDRANVLCEMPPLASPSVLPVTITSNGQQYSTNRDKSSSLTVYGITSISPKCASQEGVALLTVKGQYLIDELDLTRTESRFWCRYGTVTEVGQTKPNGVSPGQVNFLLFSFHSKATPSRLVPGALECAVPPSTVETDFFGISLNAEEISYVAGDSFYIGQWDSNPSVRFGTYFPPAVIPSTIANPGQPYIFRMVPTLGGVAGATRVTIKGMRFGFSKYHPNSPRGTSCAVSGDSSCSKPLCNVAPIPTCTFGMSSTTEVEILDDKTLVCISPVLGQRITQSIIVNVEFALDGQSFSSSGLAFQYNPSTTVAKVEPTAGVVSGGTPVLVYGTNFQDSGDVAAAVPQSPNVLKCVFISTSDSTERYAMDAVFLSSTSVQCDSPRVPKPERFIVDVSLSGQTSLLQLTRSTQQFLFYQDPVVDVVAEPIGTIHGGEMVNIRGSFFVNLGGIVCKFGDIVRPAFFISVNTISCAAPQVNRPARVPLTVSMNGVDFTSANITYVFYELLEVHPSSGPIQGGTWMKLKVDGGPTFVPSPAFEYHVKFGLSGNDRLVAGTLKSSSGGMVELLFLIPRYTAACAAGAIGCIVTPSNERLQVGAEDHPARVSVAFTTKKQFGSFPGKDFMFYDSAYTSVLPCKSESGTSCRTLSVPKDGKQYAVTFKGTGLVDVLGIKCAFYPLRTVTDLNQWDRWFSSKNPGEIDFRTKIQDPSYQTSSNPDVILIDGVYDATEAAIGCLLPGLDTIGNMTLVGDRVTYAANVASLVQGYVATVALNGQNFDHEEFQILYLNPPRVSEIRSMAGRRLRGGMSTVSMSLRVVGSHWAIADSMSIYKEGPTVLQEALLGGIYPNTLSCVFYAPPQTINSESIHRFVDAQDPHCNGTYCEATCLSPIYTTEEMDRGMLFTQVFMSMNRRDPCMRCGCQNKNTTKALLAEKECVFCSGQSSGDSEAQRILIRTGCFHAMQRDDGWDFHSPVSQYDSKTDSFCNNKQLSHTSFCGNKLGCPLHTNPPGTKLRLHACSPSLHFSNFTFYSPPSIQSVSPETVSVVNNKTLQVALSGGGLNGAVWRQYPDGIWTRPDTYCTPITSLLNEGIPVVVKIHYQSGGSSVEAVITDVKYNFCQEHILVNVPIPCAALALRPQSVEPVASAVGQYSGCFRGPFANTNFNQSTRELVFELEISFNDGLQFSPLPYSVTHVTSPYACPADGCGHGTCLDGGTNSDQPQPRCVCGIFENPTTTGSGQGQGTCLRNGAPNPSTTTPWGDTPWGKTGAVKHNWMVGGSDDISMEPAAAFVFCPPDDNRAGCQGTLTGKNFKRYAEPLNAKQVALLEESVLKRGRTDMGCSAGPSVDYIWPTLGSSTGGTTITVDMNMWWYPAYSKGPWQFFEQITDAENSGRDSSIACYFRDCNTSSRAIIQAPVSGTLAQFRCDVPPGRTGLTELTVSLRNKKGDKSPLDFAGVFGFQYYTIPKVMNIRLMNATTWERSPFANYISAPMCKTCAPRTENAPEGRSVGECMPQALEISSLNVKETMYPIGADCPLWSIFVNGTNFINSDPLECQYALANGNFPASTKATWISSTVVECAIPQQAQGAWKGQNVYLKVTLDGIVYTQQMFQVDFYPQPTVVALTVNQGNSQFRQVSLEGFGVDWRESENVLKKLFGVSQVHREEPATMALIDKLEIVPQYFRRAPTKGGTPLALYVADGCSSCNTARQLDKWKDSILLKFSHCPAPHSATSHAYLDDCTCQGGTIVPLTKAPAGDSNPSRSGGKTGGYNDRTVWKLEFATPVMQQSEAGEYLVCLAINGLHFVPLEEEAMNLQAATSTIRSLNRVGFSFYANPILTSLGFTSGPIEIEPPYTLHVLGQKFLTNVISGPRYPHMVQVYFGGIDTAGVTVPFSFRRANPMNVTVPSPSRLNVVVPSMTQIFTENFKVNISISFNGYDFTTLEFGVSEFLLYGIPRVDSIFPRFGHTDFGTVITIFGANFQNSPGRTKCKYESDGGRESLLVPADYVSSTEMRCVIVARLKGPNDEFPQIVKRMSVKFSADGTESTRVANPSLFKSLLVTAGEFRMLQDVPSLNISATALPIEGGVLFPVTIAQRSIAEVSANCDEACGRSMCIDFVEMARIHPVTQRNSLQIAIVPSSGSWRILRPAEYEEVIQTTFELTPGVANLKRSVFVEGEMFQRWTCVTTIFLMSPVLPFPMLGSLKFSYNDGQKFVGPAATILFFRTLLPTGLAPARGSQRSMPRPQVTNFLTRDILNGASPSITSTQAKNAFKRQVGCDPKLYYTCRVDQPNCRDGLVINGCCEPKKVMVCAIGPQCSFKPISTNTSSITSAEFSFGDVLSFLCVPPAMPILGSAQVNVSLDGFSFLPNPAIFFFYQPPKVHKVFPSNGLFESETKLRITGTGFLRNDPGQVQMFCIFDFKNVTPAVDVWSIPRVYTPARFLATDKLECNAPHFTPSQRPSVPQYPRAQVGIIVDGECRPAETCAKLANVDSSLWSDAFFQYTDRPSITRVEPSTAFALQGGLMVTIFGTNFFRRANYGRKSSFNALVDDARGFTEENFLRLDQSWDNPIYGLTCRFGNFTSMILTDPQNLVPSNCGLPRRPCTQVRCLTPRMNLAGINIYDVQVSLNSETKEYSNALHFTFNTPRVSSLTPKEGTAAGGGIVNITGDNFIDTPCGNDNPQLRACLQCKFSATTGITKRVAAMYVNSQRVACQVPSALEMGYRGLATGCGIQGIGAIDVTVSSNGVEYTASTGNTLYTYQPLVFFENFEPVAGPVEGNTTVTVIGRGFCPGSVIMCRFGSTDVRAKYNSFRQIECLSPPRKTAPTRGGVFTGFSTNNVNFCELLPVLASEPNGPFTCNFTNANPKLARPFFYHKAMTVLDIVPPAGIDAGGTEVHITGTGFTDYGQRLKVYFGEGDYEVAVSAEHINDTHIKFTSPKLPEQLNSPNQDTAGEGKYYFRDKAYSIRVTSNDEQFTTTELGQLCLPGAGTDGNPQARCTLPFVMFTWYTNPTILTVSKQVSQFYQGLSLPLYASVKDFTDIPQGPVTGGTIVTIKGVDFTSLGRPRIDGGVGVRPQDCRGDYVTSPCFTTCNFPFIHAIQGSQYYYTCINLRWRSDQTIYNPSVFWCVVGESKTFANQYGICNTDIASWKDFKQGGKFVTNLECRFGQVHVPAIVIDNSTIRCQSPPHNGGIIVPLSVTMNRKDYSRVLASTYFQYIKPAPTATLARVSNAVSSLTVSFSNPLNLQGLMGPSNRMKVVQFKSNCQALFKESFIESLGKNTFADCRWTSDNTSLVITFGQQPVFSIGDTVVFAERNCEKDGTCWSKRSQTDLLITPFITRQCNYPTIIGGCDQLYSQSERWCGRCIPSHELVGIPVIPAMDLSYPFNQSTMALKISAPSAPILPTVVISGSKNVDNCQEACFGGPNDGKACSPACSEVGVCRTQLVELSGESSFGAAGKDFKSIVWGLDPSQTTDMGLLGNLSIGQGKLSARFFSSSKSANLKLGQNLTYCFTLTLTNWLGAIGKSSSCYRVIQFGDITPSFQVSSAARINSQTGQMESLLSQDLVMVANASLSSCASNNSINMNVRFIWTINPTPPGWDNVVTSVARLNIPALTVDWMPGLAYELTLTVALAKGDVLMRSHGSSVSVQYAIVYSRTQAVARISGGSRTVGTMDHLVVDASTSYNPDVPEQSRNPTKDLVFCWSCVGSRMNRTDSGTWVCPKSPGEPCGWTVPTDDSTPTWTIHRNETRLSRCYHVSVKVKAAGGKCAHLHPQDPLAHTSTVSIETIERMARPPVASIIPLDLPFLDYSSPIRMSGDVFSGNCHNGYVTAENCKVQYEWTFDPDIKRITISKPDPGYGRVSLILPEKILDPIESQLYTIRLTATGSDGMIGSSQMSVRVNIGPQSGTFRIMPSTGTAMDTLFSLVSNGWNDENVPLQYEFRVKSYIEVCSQNCRIESMDVSMGRRMSSTQVTTLPSGDPSKNDRMEVHAFIFDALGAVTSEMSSVRVESVKITDISDLVSKATAEFNKALSSGDFSGASTQLGLFGGLMGHKALAGPAMAVQAAVLRDSLGDLVARFYAVGGRRRRRSLLAISQATCDETCIRDLGNNVAFIGATSNPAHLTRADCSPVLKTIRDKLSSAFTIGSDDMTKKTNAQNLLRVVGKCQQHLTLTTYLQATEIIDYVGVLIMKGTVVGDQEVFELEYGVLDTYNFFVVYKRFSSVRLASETVNARTGVSADLIEVEIPASMTDPGGRDTFDIQVVLFGKMVNPYQVMANTTLNSRMIRINARSTQIVSTANANTIANYPVESLASPVVISMDMFAAVGKEETKNKTSGAYRGSVCGSWNSSALDWAQFDQMAQNAEFSDGARSERHTIHCSTRQLISEFAVITGVVGCDGKASANPAVNNVCLKCNGGAPGPRQGICDYRGVPCLLADSKQEVQAYCPHLENPNTNACPPENPFCCLDSCYVCKGKNNKFKEIKLVNESGVCNFKGVACPGTTEPTICGICDVAANKQNRQKNAGICDCFDGGTPNGGKILDRCNVCGGGNSSMDYCGHNPKIPSLHVCHTNGEAGNALWNASCTGCDGVPRPDLKWVQSPVKRWRDKQCTRIDSQWGNGGVQCDNCEVCGGDDSTCVGCDGVAGSGEALDVCKVCGGDGSACKGCDGSAKYTPTQLDLCAVCGGSIFTACNSRGFPTYFCSRTDYQPHYIDSLGRDQVLTARFNKADFEENQFLCKQWCDGVPGSGKTFNKCGRCGALDNVCLSPCCEAGSSIPGCVNSQSFNCWTRMNWLDRTKGCEYGVYQDLCGKCGGDSSTCQGCDLKPFSGRVNDLCGECDGDGSSCVGCDGQINSGKVRDSCQVCDGGDMNRDICGVCIFPPDKEGLSCSGCDGKPHSGRAVDACGECGGANLCKWRDGDPPPESKGSTDAVVLDVSLGPG